MAELEAERGGRRRCWGWRGGRSTRLRRAGRRSPTAAATSSTAARWRRSFDGADVAVHLAFAIFGGREETRRVNLEGSRNVFEAAIEAGVKRLVYASSVAAYGFHADNPQPLTEDGAGPRQRELLLLGPEGRAGGGCSTSCSPGAGWTPTSSGPASSPGRGRRC